MRRIKSRGFTRKMGECPAAGRQGAKTHTRECLFSIRDWCAWTPGRETEASWREWAGGRRAATTGDDPIRNQPPAILRRRVSALGQAALRAAWGLPDIHKARIILASRHGEFGRTLSILDSLAAGTGVSPADFTLSVHHALVGLLSIATNNRQGHTAIAAGAETFGLGFVEAVACLAEQPVEPVVLLYFDEALPIPFDRFNENHQGPLAVALTLTAAAPGETFAFTAVSPASGPPGRSVQALDFLKFLLSGDSTLVSRGEHLQWQWTRHAVAA